MTSPIRVHVHLATAQDAADWKQRYEADTLVGVNDPSPYGYARANHMGCDVTFSAPGKKGTIREIARLVLRAMLGFDYLHARNNRSRILAADAVWTYTESQFLGVAAVLATRPRNAHRPKLIGQAVWMFDHWSSFFFVQKWLCRRLIKYVDILPVHSPLNAQMARDLFPESRIEFIHFGIPNETVEPVVDRSANPTHVLALGNDRHWDWKTAIDALGGQDDIQLTILSSSAHPSVAARKSNVTILPARTNAQLKQYLRGATIMLVPLKTNLHASGITAIQEAALFGLPVIATDTGGLRSYFDETCVTYIEPGDPADLLAAVRRLAADPDARIAQAKRAQARTKAADMGCEAYVRRYADWTHELVGPR
jgi:glycosyltransferase involved in cell wall biosynthesis